MRLHGTKYTAGMTDARGRIVDGTTIRLYVTGSADDVARVVALGCPWVYAANKNGVSSTVAEAYCYTPDDVDVARSPLRELGVR